MIFQVGLVWHTFVWSLSLTWGVGGVHVAYWVRILNLRQRRKLSFGINEFQCFLFTDIPAALGMFSILGSYRREAAT